MEVHTHTQTEDTPQYSAGNSSITPLGGAAPVNCRRQEITQGQGHAN
jgi:hypothetical protein